MEAPSADGPFQINGRCIDCGTCWQFDPQHFAQGPATALVQQQPHGPLETERALLALQACPVAAIEAPSALRQRIPRAGFPDPVCQHPGGQVFYCGWASKRSFGACSWLIVRPEGNVLIDVPRWSAPLARRIQALGGVAAIVLTHRDDVADHAQWARAFGCERWIHAADADAAPEAERLIEGDDVVGIGSDLSLIPTPGHTAGSLCLQLGQSRSVLFSGDHLWWNSEQQVVVASQTYCWWNFQEQIRSVRKLRELDVAWLLPGHGHRRHFEPGEWRRALDQTLAWIS
jgi:glyoxylase-like metal-dependent hydrolase (beta-lactamase superfamily II)/ferredoxin